MRWLPGVRFWLALSVGGVVGLVAYFWPASPHTVVRCDHICWHLAFSPDSTQLAVLDREAGLNQQGQILVWDVATGKLLHQFDYGIRLYPSKVRFAPDGRSLGLIDAGSVTKWDLKTDRRVAHYEHANWLHDPDQYYGREILFSAAGDWLAHDVSEGRVYDVETGRIVSDYGERWPDRNLSAHDGHVAVFVKGKVKTFDVLTGAEVGMFSPAMKPGIARRALTFSPDGTHRVYYDGWWIVSNGVTGWRRDSRNAFDGMVDGCFSGDNRYLAVSVVDSSLMAGLRARLFDTRRRTHVFNTVTGAEVCQPMPGGCLSCFAPDGKTLAVACTDNVIALWDWPPSSRWPRVIALAAPTMILSCGVGLWWSHRSRRGAGRLIR